jgi:TfoX/Sxy family transcriptional regulator of competence genes
MRMPRPTEEGKELFRDLVTDFAGVTVKPMFANLGAFVGGTMFAALIGDTIGVRLLDDSTRAELAARPGAGGFGPGEKPLREYVGLPLTFPRDELVEWLHLAYLQIGELPPKPPKPSRAQKKGPA